MRRLVIALFLVVLAAGVVAWFAWLDRGGIEDREVAVFRADPAPFRVAPETADVSEIPNTGILVLETTANGEETEGHEVLMPPPEEPLVLDTGAREVRDEVVDVTEAPLESAIEGVAAEPIFDADQVTAMVDEALDESPPLVPPLPGDRPSAPQVDWRPDALAADDAAGTGSLSFSDVAASLGEEAVGDPEIGSERRYGVRVASLSSEEAAVAAWDRLHREHNDLFGGMEAIITRTSVDGSLFFRVTIGEFEAKQNAEDLCAAAVERGLDCLVVTH